MIKISKLRNKFILKKIIIFFVTIFFVTFIILEILLRLFLGNCGIGHLFDLKDLSKGYVKLSPNKSILHTGLLEKIPPVEQKINSFGYRGLNRSPKKKQNSFRIIIIGDSFTFCPGLEEGMDYPSMLEFYLHNKIKDVEVLNFGIPSHNLTDLKMHLLDTGLKFNPDMIILQIASNDFSPSIFKILCSTDKLLKCLFSFSHKSYVGRFLFACYLIRSESYTISYQQLWSEFKQIINEIIDKTSELKIKLVVTSFGDPFIKSEFSLESYFYDKGIVYIPFPKNLNSHLSYDFHHLDEDGANKYAKILSKKICKVT